MSVDQIKLTPDFRRQATRAVVAIGVFALVYVLLLFLALILTVLCIYAGLAMIIARPGFLTLALGAGISSMGVLILIFVTKFIFSKNKVDVSHLQEVTESEQPKLFEFIRDIVEQTNTHFPGKVYLSWEVNASVFYNSSFWSMFLPVRKNLMIGMGLVNIVTKQELKAILAHEFGHFSQRSMKIGTYVYNVNKVIFNMLYENDGYMNLASRWASVNGYFSFFVSIAVKGTQGIQWILRQVYGVVNRTYMALSREMEFHADETAAHVAGYAALKTSLMRLDLATNALQTVVEMNQNRKDIDRRSTNVFPQHLFVMHHTASELGIALINGFPDMTGFDSTRFNKSKLVIKDQWASHPTTEDRVGRLEKTGIKADHEEQGPANELFRNVDSVQQDITKTIIGEPEKDQNADVLSLEEFSTEYERSLAENSFPKLFNEYYDTHNIIQFDLQNFTAYRLTTTVERLFSNDAVSKIRCMVALESDLETIRQVAGGNTGLKTFDYDGVKYKWREANDLASRLDTELAELKKEVGQNDIEIYRYFTSWESGRKDLESLYDRYFRVAKSFKGEFEVYKRLLESLQFVTVTTPTENIRGNFEAIVPLERSMKATIRELLEDDALQAELSSELKDLFKRYLSKDWSYFGVEVYQEENLQMLFGSMHAYAGLLSRRLFIAKKRLLEHQASLVSAMTSAA